MKTEEVIQKKIDELFNECIQLSLKGIFEDVSSEEIEKIAYNSLVKKGQLQALEWVLELKQALTGEVLEI